MGAHRRGRAPRERRPSPAPTAPAAAAPAAAAAAAAYKLAELARAAGITPRTVRLYVTREVLHAPVFRGRSTTYGHEHLVRLRAIARLRAEERLDLDAIRRRLARLSPAEIAALAAPPPGPGAPAAAGEAVPPGVPGPDGAERWDRLALLPGLELHVRGDATAVVRRLAAEIRARYGAVPAERA